MISEIRPACAANVPLILEFIRGLADYEKLTDAVEATEEKLRRTLFPEAGAASAAYCVLAFAGGVPAGFAFYFFNYSTFLAKPGLYLEDLYVKTEYRGQGIGRALLLQWTVLDWNQPAIDFYEKIGAQRMKEWQICRLTGASLTQYA